MIPALLAPLFLIFLALAGAAAVLPLAVSAYYSLSSLLTFLVYTLDEYAARSGGWRVRESTLHLLALAGGWPGALLAQQRLHHKSQKLRFQVPFWGTVIMNCAALGWLFSPAGKEAIRAALGSI